MKCPVPGVRCQVKALRIRQSSTCHSSHITRHSPRAFTLIELMVVVAIMGVILLAGIPSLAKLIQKEGMRKVVSDVMDVCTKARAQAILSGSPVDVMFHPRDKRLEVQSSGVSRQVFTEGGERGTTISEQPVVTPGQGQSAQIPEDFVIEMLDINLSEYRESDWARVRFYPNGTSDEMTLIVRSPKNEWKKITTEVTTGVVDVNDLVR